MARLKARQMREATSSLEGCRIVVASSIPLGGGKFLAAGTDVTKEAPSWPTFQTHVRRGVLTIVREASEAVVAVAKAVAAPSPVSVAVAAKEVAEAVSAVGDAISLLRSVNATSSKVDLRSAILLCGVVPPNGATRDELFKIRNEILEKNAA